LEATISARLTPAEGRKFALPVGAAFLVLAGIAFWRGHPLSSRVFGILAVSLVLAGLVIPSYLGPVSRGWMALAHAISKVTTPIFMGVVYFVVLTPIGVGMRLAGRQPMRNKEFQNGFWVRPQSGGRSDISRQF
jgi:hypothetical protein